MSLLPYLLSQGQRFVFCCSLLSAKCRGIRQTESREEKVAFTGMQSKQFLLLHQGIAVPAAAFCILPIQTKLSKHWSLSVNLHLFQRQSLKIHSFGPTGEATLFPQDSWQLTGMACKNLCNLYVMHPCPKH